MNPSKVKQELESIRIFGGGILYPKDVVEFAKTNTDSALHTCFEWDNDAAAELHRLHQARQIIRTAVVILESKDKIPVSVRAYIAMPSDKTGYRATVEVVNNQPMAEEALRMFQREIDRLRVRFGKFALLADLLDEVSLAVQERKGEVDGGEAAATNG